MIDLKAIARAERYRLAYEPPASRRSPDPWLAILPGAHGHVYIHGADQLAFATTRLRANFLIQNVPGVVVLQDGSDGINATFPLDGLSKVAKSLGLYRKRELTPEQREVAIARLKAYQFPAAQRDLTDSELTQTASGGWGVT